MKYFIDEDTRKQRGGTCYFEFQQGMSNDFWRDDSILLHADIFDDMGLYKFFKEGLGSFDYYGHTVISADEWDKLYKLALSKGDETAELFGELNSWAEECYKHNDVIVVIGV